MSAEFNLPVLVGLACFEISPITYAIILSSHFFSFTMSLLRSNVPQGWISVGTGNGIHSVINALLFE